MREQKRLLLTDTTFRDAHQSLLATRLRTHDLVGVGAATTRATCPGCSRWRSGAGPPSTWPCASCSEDPWDRLAQLRDAVPNILLQMLLRASNAVGYTNYPDNVVRYFVAQAAEAGIDLFRVFDCAQLGREHARGDGRRARVGDAAARRPSATRATSPTRRGTKYDLAYYVRMAKELEAAGAHILGIKDMAGLCKPEAARLLVTALREEVGLPVHFHTHDTRGLAAARRCWPRPRRAWTPSTRPWTR